MLFYAPLIGRTIQSNLMHGTAPTIIYANKQWQKVNSRINWVQNSNTRWASLGSSSNREHIILDENSEKMRHLKNRAIELCRSKTGNIQEILSTVNEIINELTDRPGVERKDIESRLDDLLNNFINHKIAISHAPNASPSITIDELIDQKLLVCRHKGLLVASLLGELVRQGILPEGTVRHYRTELDEGGVHTFAMYREKVSNDLYICDPRWNYIENVSRSPIKVEAMGYGHRAVQAMVKRLDALDTEAFRLKVPAQIIREKVNFNLRDIIRGAPDTQTDTEDTSYDEEYDSEEDNDLGSPWMFSTIPNIQHHQAREEPRIVPTIIEIPNPTINFLSDNPYDRYRDLKREQSSTTRFMKRLGGAFSDKAEIRNNTIIRMQDLFQKLNANNSISVFEKAKILYSYLFNIETSIERENNRFDSTLQILCQAYQMLLRSAFIDHPEMIDEFRMIKNGTSLNHEQYIQRAEDIISGERIARMLLN